MKNELFNIKTIAKCKKMPDIIAEALRDGILRGTLEGGVQLKQDEIAKKFDVSLIPVREALIQLETQGLVKSIRNKGVIVTPLSLDEMTMVFEARSVLETGAAELIIHRAEKDKLHQMRNLLGQMEEQTDAYRFNSLNTLFHQILIDSTYNNHLSETYHHLFIRAERYCMHLLYHAAIMKKIKEDHRKIILCIEEKDSRQLAGRLKEHVEESQKLFIKRGFTLDTVWPLQ